MQSRIAPLKQTMATIYTVTLTNEQRITLRRFCRETLTSLQTAVTAQVQLGELDSAKRLADEARVASECLGAIRAALESQG
jgi:hypothetical protein